MTEQNILYIFPYVIVALLFVYYSFEIRKKDKKAIIISLNNSFFQKTLYSLNDSISEKNWNELCKKTTKDLFNYLDSLDGILIRFNCDAKIFVGKDEVEQILESVIAGEEIKTKKHLYLIEESNMKVGIVSALPLAADDKTLIKLFTLLINILYFGEKKHKLS